MDEFRLFVGKHPEVRNDVLNGKKTWQQVYENWVILGEESDTWQFNQNNNSSPQQQKNKSETKKLEDLLSSDNLKTIVGYIKKINPDTLSKTLNTIQKVLQITQSFGGGATSGVYNASYNSWWE
jgi:hypothetical protein